VGNILATSTTATSTFRGGLTVGSTQFMVDRYTGRVGIGIDKPTGGYILDIASTSATLVAIRNYSSTGGLDLTRGGGTFNSPSSVSDTNVLGAITFRGYTSNDYYTGAMIQAVVDGTPGTTVNLPTYLSFTTNRGAAGIAEQARISKFGNFLMGTTTGNYRLTVSSSTEPQLSLSAGGGITQWTFRNAGGDLFLSTTTVAGTATTSISALSISGSGFGTTTVLGLNISGQATSTSNVGFNLTGGCFAINGTCISGSSSSSVFPFDSLSGYNSTSTTIGFTNGLFSTASSTFSSNLFLSSLGQEQVR
jgi:hypothetical protein